MGACGGGGEGAVLEPLGGGGFSFGLWGALILVIERKFNKPGKKTPAASN